MKFQTLAALSLASVALADKAEIMDGVYNDINSHLEEYLKIVDKVPSDLLQLFRKAQTYTDKSYTTLYDDIDINEVSTFATGLSWYDSRLKSLFGDDAAASTEAPSASTTASSEAAQSSSEAPAASSEAPVSSSAAPVSSEASSAAPSTEASDVTTAEASTAVETVNEENGAASAAVGYYMAPVAVVLGAAALL